MFKRSVKLRKLPLPPSGLELLFRVRRALCECLFSSSFGWPQAFLEFLRSVVAAPDSNTKAGFWFYRNFLFRTRWCRFKEEFSKELSICCSHDEDPPKD